MALLQRGNIWWYRFGFNGKMIQESAKTDNEQLAAQRERDRREELQAAMTGEIATTTLRKTLEHLGEAYIAEQQVRRPKSVNFTRYTVGHVTRLLGKKTVGMIDAATVRKFQNDRLKEGAAPKTINDEVIVLLRLCEERGDQIRKELKRKRSLRLDVNTNVGKAYSITEQDRLLAEADANDRSPHMAFALRLALNGGMRDGEIKNLQWKQIDFAKKILTVGEAKTAAGSGRRIPLNGELLAAFEKHTEWYTKQFHELRPGWYVFPFGRRGRLNPAKPVTTFKTAWQAIKRKAGVTGRWHDTRHTVVSQLGEIGASPATIMATVGHVSRQMLERYSHPNVDAQRQAMERMVDYRNTQRILEQQALAQLTAAASPAKKSRRATIN
jgi:integrase